MASSGKSLKLGHPELTRLWNLNPDNMEACKDESRVFLPKLDDFFANAIDQADPEAMVEEQYKYVYLINLTEHYQYNSKTNVEGPHKMRRDAAIVNMNYSAISNMGLRNHPPFCYELKVYHDV